MFRPHLGRSKWVRVFKYGIFGTVAIVGCKQFVDYYRPFDDSAVVRLMRTAYTAVDIARRYNEMLYSKEWDTTSLEYLEVKSKAHQIGANKLLELCKANKGVYIKVGQHVGALDYLLPHEYVTTMRVLHMNAPSNSVEQIYEVIREELKCSPESIFIEFDPEPLGTASLAQVHRARLKDGTEVAVKVQHGNVKDNIGMDLKWMELIVLTMSKLFPEFQMNWLIEETKTNIKKELNFLEEAHNAEKVSKMFSHYKWLKVPKIYWNYCTDRVLVMGYCKGGQINDVKYIEEHKIDKYGLCKKLGDLYSHMIFISGFVHSDPHPGNILVSKNPGEKDVTIYLLDHGLYAQLTDTFRYHYSKLWLSIIDYNKDGIKEHSVALGIRKELYVLFACMVTGRPWNAIQAGIGSTAPSVKEKMLFQNELPKLLPLITECLEHVDRQALLVFKTNDLIRSIEYSLGMQNRMAGFIVMSQCCVKNVYNLDSQKAKSLFSKSVLAFKYRWTMLLIFVYSIYLNWVSKKINTSLNCFTTAFKIQSQVQDRFVVTCIDHKIYIITFRNNV